MLAKFIDKIVELKQTQTFVIDGHTYADRSLERIDKPVDRPRSIDVSGLDSICKLIRQEKGCYKSVPLMVEVDGYSHVKVYTSYMGDFRRDYLYEAKADVPGFREGWRGHEEAIIQLMSLFVPNEGSKYMLDLLSKMTVENGVTTKDNGVSQVVEAKQGVALKEMVAVKPRVSLIPFRTFLEVPQPESDFLLRVDESGRIGLFEADGGVWKMEARRNVVNYFNGALKDMIESGDVIVLM